MGSRGVGARLISQSAEPAMSYLVVFVLAAFNRDINIIEYWT
jgi:hypothetical protein